jgi:hypothetical protein
MRRGCFLYPIFSLLVINLDCQPPILLGFDDRECMSEPFVLKISYLPRQSRVCESIRSKAEGLQTIW